ncbi:MAG TPA: T9SS type A sorting domain-containing protein, partial [Bacteroidetes bacterium]|nr:T9SS type A sorting domain-containing protein [Bacteroidota bacterium]
SGEYDDWIELHNTTSSAYSLKGHFLSDTITSLAKYDLPDTTIPAGGYLIVWADEDGMQAGLHANFKLSRLGEPIYLMNSDTIMIDSVRYSAQTTDVSSGRCWASGTFLPFTVPTPGADNNCPVAAAEGLESILLVSLFPNPTRSFLKVRVASEKPVKLQVFDLLGQERLRTVVRGGQVQLNVANWPAGTYCIRLEDGTSSLFLVQ